MSNREICGPEYYENTIKIVQEKINNPVFVVFSDDVEWAKNVIKQISGDAEVISESGKDDVAENNSPYVCL